MAVLGAVAFMAQLDFFIVNVALDAIGRSFAGSSEALVSWVLSAYAIIFAVVLVPAGRLADQYGRKRVLLGGVGRLHGRVRRRAGPARARSCT